jgi:prolyl oligopeptidase
MSKAAVFLFATAVAAMQIPVPATRTDSTVDTIHGVKIADPYRWLEDQKSPETRAWIAAQSKYTHGFLDQVPGREQTSARLRALTKRDSYTSPLAAGGTFVFLRRLPDRDQADVYVRRGTQGKDELLIDANALSPDRTKSVVLMALSKDGKLLAYGIRTGGEDEVVLKIYDFSRGRDLADDFPRARYESLVFQSEAKGFYYAIFTDEGPRIRYHAFGTPVGQDKLVFGEKLDRSQGLDVESGPGSRYMLATVWYGSAGKKTDLYIKSLADDRPLMPVVNDVEAEFMGTLAGDNLFLRTTWKAPKGRVLAVDPARPAARESWREVVPEGPAALEQVSASGGRLLLAYVENAASKLVIRGQDGAEIGTVATPAFGAAGNFKASDDDNGDVFYQFTTFLIPSQVNLVNLRTGENSVWASSPIDFRAADYDVRQVWYESRDKTRVPMFIAMKKGTALDGARPTLLTGYGGFRVAMTPGFNVFNAAWLEMGGVLALPNLRGGSEFGEEWHQAGMLEKKQNVFDDFLAAAEYLIREKYTNPKKLAIAGGSNGGLLVGAAETQRPDLFQAVVCGAPLLDMIRYHQFLVARWWVPEYGSSEDPKQFAYLLKYSPYHNVKPGVKYPATLFVTGDADTRVDPLHARKMAARLQAVNPPDRPILLLYDTKSGHSAGKPVNAQIEDWTDEFSFLFRELGMSTSR